MSDYQTPGTPNTSGAGSTPPPPPPGYQQPGYGQQPGYQPGYPGQPGYAGQAGYGGPTPGWRRPGELLDRFLARLMDHVMLAVVNGILISAVILGAALNSDGNIYFGYGESILAGIVSAVLGVAISLGYFVLMETRQGRTLGKMVMKLHVEGASGGKPTAQESVKRNIWMALPLLGIIPLIGEVIGSLAQLIAVIMIAVGISNDPVRRRPWTDNFAGTQVIKQG